MAKYIPKGYIMKTVVGDLIEMAVEGHVDVLVHGCNCFCTMNSGIAKQVRETFPQAFAADLKTERGDVTKLGTYTEANSWALVVVNAYTQFTYGYGGERYVNYDAIRSVFSAINTDFKGKKVGIPKIGAGLAGGNWAEIEAIIEEVTPDINVTLVVLS